MPAPRDRAPARELDAGGNSRSLGGFWIAALMAGGRRELAATELIKLAAANRLGNWAFNEWLHGRTLDPSGMAGQSWNAAAFPIARHAVATAVPLFAP